MTGTATAQMAVLRALPDDPKTSLDLKLITSLSGLTYKAAVVACGKLLLRGYAKRSENGFYSITSDGLKSRESGEVLTSGPNGPLTGKRRSRADSLRQRMWNAMRQKAAGDARNAFTFPDILMLASKADEDAERSHNNAATYFGALKKTGYLLTINRRVPGTRPGSNGFALHRLVRDQGDLAPVHRQRSKVVYDPNTKEVFAC